MQDKDVPDLAGRFVKTAGGNHVGDDMNMHVDGNQRRGMVHGQGNVQWDGELPHRLSHNHAHSLDTTEREKERRCLPPPSPPPHTHIHTHTSSVRTHRGRRG